MPEIRAVRRPARVRISTRRCCWSEIRIAALARPASGTPQRQPAADTAIHPATDCHDRNAKYRALAWVREEREGEQRARSLIREI
jgi:hypothetical protein